MSYEMKVKQVLYQSWTANTLTVKTKKGIARKLDLYSETENSYFFQANQQMASIEVFSWTPYDFSVNRHDCSILAILQEVITRNNWQFYTDHLFKVLKRVTLES